MLIRSSDGVFGRDSEGIPAELVFHDRDSKFGKVFEVKRTAPLNRNVVVPTNVTCAIAEVAASTTSAAPVVTMLRMLFMGSVKER